MNEMIGKALAFVKKHLQYFVYGLSGIATVILAACLLTWMMKGKVEQVVQMKNATLVCENELATEYLVRQSFNPDGAELDIGSKRIPIEECQINADFSSAGDKTVRIIYQASEYLSYVAEFDCRVYFVRSLDIESYPNSIAVDGDSAVADEHFKMHAILAEKPETDVFGDVKAVDGGYRIELDENTYTYTLTEDLSTRGFYGISYYCGNVSASFSFYNAAGKSYIVESTKDIVKFQKSAPEALDDGQDGENVTDTPTEESAEGLTLIVTQKTPSYQTHGVGKSSGYYVYNDGETETEYAFSYELKDKEEAFGSSYVAEAFDGEKYSATVDGNTFVANRAEWQSAVVNGNIVDDNGFKVVIGSDDRILHFTYRAPELEEPTEPTDPTDTPDTDEPTEPTADDSTEPTEPETALPSLTLYICSYDMNPLLGTGNGYSYGVYIYTDRSGVSHKMSFYMQAWTWTYVPLSSTHSSDITADASVSDIVVNEALPDDDPNKYNSYTRGTLFAHVSFFERGEGVITDTFTAPEEEWLGAIMGL